MPLIALAIAALAFAVLFHAVVRPASTSALTQADRNLLMSLLTDVQALDADVVALTTAITAPAPTDDPEVVAAVAQLTTDMGALKDKLTSVGVVPAA